MNFDIASVPFSYKGAYMAFCFLPENFENSGNPEGLYLKSVRGGVLNAYVCNFVPTLNARELAFTCEAYPAELVLHTAFGDIGICFENDGIIVIRGQQTDKNGDILGLRLRQTPGCSGFRYIHECMHGSDMNYMLNVHRNPSRYLAHALSGRAEATQDWRGRSAVSCCLDFICENGIFAAVLEEVNPEWEPKTFSVDYDTARKNAGESFEAFCALTPEVPEEYSETRLLAAYVNWSAYVKKSGQLKRDAMLMSKNWMSALWSWDHCFNALSLVYGNPGMAWEQFMVAFDFQDKTGRLPDCITDTTLSYNYCKPPVHGWTLLRLMEHMELSQQQISEAYDKLSRLTEWWLNYRDTDKDGICEYWHGNDSGWDNSTAFSSLPPVELPELAAYLIIQMDALALLCEKSGQNMLAEIWRQKSGKMLEDMVSHCYVGGKPVSRLCRTHEIIENESLILYIPILLADRLPQEILKNTLDTLKSDRFLTEFGYASESPKSQKYKSDGYWQGPIWAPPTIFIIEGLYKSGEKELARAAAEKFCRMVKRSGCAENFDALSGEGLCDKAYTWTSSVFLILAHDYLL